MAEVITLPGVERPSLGSTRILPTDAVFGGALENGVTEVVVVGRQRDGSLYVAAANGDAEKVVGMLMRAIHLLTAEDYTPDSFDTDD